MSNKFDDFSTQIQDLVAAVKEIKDENNKFIEQEQFGKHVKIIGVPTQDKENCAKIVKTISSTLGINLSTVNAYHVRTKNMNNKFGIIVAEMNSKEDKASLIDLAKKKRLSENNLNVNWESNSIYVNNYLTQSNRNLFYLNSNIFQRT